MWRLSEQFVYTHTHQHWICITYIHTVNGFYNKTEVRCLFGAIKTVNTFSTFSPRQLELGPTPSSTKPSSNSEMRLLAASISCGLDTILKTFLGVHCFENGSPHIHLWLSFMINQMFTNSFAFGEGVVRIWNESCQRNSTKSLFRLQSWPLQCSHNLRLTVCSV